MFLKQIQTGGDRNFGYVIGCESEKVAAVIDPSYDPEALVQAGTKAGYRFLYGLNTHGHYDHVGGNAAFTQLTGAPVVKMDEVEPASGTRLEDGATLPLGTLSIRCIHAPGHTDDSLCYFVGGALFTGDVLFVGKVGGTHSEAAARKQYDALHEKLMILPPETVVYPGHDVGAAPTSTIRAEKEGNPFLIQPDFAAFLHLKANWAAYKQEHGIA